MRLAIVAPHFPEYALRYAAAMARHGEVLVCVDAGQLAAEYRGRTVPERDGCTVRPVRFKTPLDLLRLLRSLRRFRPTVVHFQEAAGPRRGLFNSVAAVLLRRSALVVLTVHDPMPHAGRDRAAARRTAPMSGHLRRLADVVVVHGAHCAGLYRQAGFGTGQRVVESDHGLILEPSALRPPPGGPLHLYLFGRMEAYKGVEVLLLAVERLHGEGLPLRLSVAGEGPELDRLHDRFQRLPGVRVHRGFVPPVQVIEGIQDANCVVLPYLSATQSGVLAAAFAGRRFVIASETGGLPDVVEHGGNGLLVPPGDPVALAGAIRAAAQAPALRRRLGDGAVATAAGRLDWDRIADALAGTFAGPRPSRK